LFIIRGADGNEERRKRGTPMEVTVGGKRGSEKKSANYAPPKSKRGVKF